MVAMYRAHCYHYHPEAKTVTDGSLGCLPAINKVQLIQYMLRLHPLFSRPEVIHVVDCLC
jgi:hypothetical protein